jgi:hypothetical protein
LHRSCSLKTATDRRDRAPSEQASKFASTDWLDYFLPSFPHDVEFTNNQSSSGHVLGEPWEKNFFLTDVVRASTPQSLICFRRKEGVKVEANGSTSLGLASSTLGSFSLEQLAFPVLLLLSPTTKSSSNSALE